MHGRQVGRTEAQKRNAAPPAVHAVVLGNSNLNKINYNKMKTSVQFLVLSLVLSWLGCNAQKNGEVTPSVTDYFQEIPEKYRFGYTIQKEGTEWLRKDDQGMPVESRKIILSEKYLQVGLSIKDNTDSVCVKIFPLKEGNMIGISHFGSSFDLNGGQVWGDVYFLKKENGTWKEITSEVMPKIAVQDFYKEKIGLKEGYTALKYEFTAQEGISANLLVSYSAELDCMGGRDGEVKGEVQKEGCILIEKKKYDKIALKWDAEKTKLLVEKP